MELERYVVGPVGTNCYVLFHPAEHDCIVVDPGDSGFAIGKHLLEKGYRPRAILLTHGHFDHVSGVEQLQNFVQAHREEFDLPKEEGHKHVLPAYILDREEATLKDPAINLSGGMGGSPRDYSSIVDTYVTDGQELFIMGLKIRVIATPGHTPGGCCYYIPLENYLFSGDTLFCQSVGRTDFPGGSTAQIVRSIREKLLVLPDHTRVYPGHESETTIGFEKEYNPYA
ncbi:MAG: MBL fold metallo-hydrolase [Lachnospiraceae bacterium]|nr:MBL fold metallo-hydrolase [Lachnospiraceae bacterium]